MKIWHGDKTNKIIASTNKNPKLCCNQSRNAFLKHDYCVYRHANSLIFIFYFWNSLVALMLRSIKPVFQNWYSVVAGAIFIELADSSHRPI